MENKYTRKDILKALYNFRHETPSFEGDTRLFNFLKDFVQHYIFREAKFSYGFEEFQISMNVLKENEELEAEREYQKQKEWEKEAEEYYSPILEAYDKYTEGGQKEKKVVTERIYNILSLEEELRVSYTLENMIETEKLSEKINKLIDELSPKELQLYYDLVYEGISTMELFVNEGIDENDKELTFVKTSGNIITQLLEGISEKEGKTLAEAHNKLVNELKIDLKSLEERETPEVEVIALASAYEMDVNRVMKEYTDGGR